MAFENLKSTGIKYLLGKLKTVFLQIKDAVKTVNGNEADENGNITINSVPYAENLISDSTQTSHDSFIIRTSGGTASIESGDAWLMSISGNSVHEGFVAEELEMVVNTAEREEGVEPITATINRDTFVEYVTESGTITLSYTTAWNANPATYGITVTGTPVDGDNIIITYVKEQRGIIYQSNPQAFISTGWNLFNYSEGYARVVKYSDDYGFRIEGTYTAVQYSATLTGAKSAITVTNGNFTIPDDGFVWVTGGNSSDTAVFMTWSDWTEGANGGTFEAYEESVVDLSPLFNGEGCPLPYGLLNVGTVSDEVNLNLGVVTKRVDRLAYNATNLATAKSSGREYDYDTDYIYLALATPVTVSVAIDGSIVTSDHGIEIFDQTDVPVTTQTLYGNNLRNKLERDVMTKSNDLVDNLTTNDGTKALSAKQGKLLNDQMIYKNIGSFSTETGLATALNSELDLMANYSQKSIRFNFSSANGAFGQYYYYGTLTKGGSSTYASMLVEVMATSSASYVVSGSKYTNWIFRNTNTGNISQFQFTCLKNGGKLRFTSSDAQNSLWLIGAYRGSVTTLNGAWIAVVATDGAVVKEITTAGSKVDLAYDSTANKLTLTNTHDTYDAYVYAVRLYGTGTMTATQA